MSSRDEVARALAEKLGLVNSQRPVRTDLAYGRVWDALIDSELRCEELERYGRTKYGIEQLLREDLTKAELRIQELRAALQDSEEALKQAEHTIELMGG